MDPQLGHDVKKFNPTNRESLREMVKFITAKLKDKDNKTFALYGARKGEELKKLIDSEKIKDKDSYEVEDMLMENDSFILREHPKLMVAAVPHRA